mmetsp:Transcript_88197/g.169863  ORF Transcript_88197/g.169863 Transcript_88197/m.169863 type:complete len:465 (+) Transcript_88197:72-1466(+)
MSETSGLLRKTQGKNPKTAWIMPETLKRNTRMIAIAKWVMPMVMAGFFQVFVMLVFGRIATHLYVQEMLYEVKHTPLTDNAPKPNFDTSSSYNQSEVSYGSLNDPIQFMIGWQFVPIQLLDAFAALFPAFFVFGAIFFDELKVWTQVMICNTLLAFGKGVFEVMTIIPDSIGWQYCKDRLGDEGVKWHSQPRSMGDFIWFEFHKFFGGLKIRYCADMMWSGHTYVVTLYALGVFELCRRQTKKWKNGNRLSVLAVVALVAIIQQGVEIYYILLNRFHYSIDVAIAVVMTFLLYTNGAVAACAKSWVRLRERERSAHFKQEEFLILKVKLSELESDGEVIIPPCCLPFCCHAGQQHIYDDEDIVRLVSHPVTYDDLKPDTQIMQDIKNQINELLESGEIANDDCNHGQQAQLYHCLDNMAIYNENIPNTVITGKKRFRGDTSECKKCPFSKICPDPDDLGASSDW